MPIELHHAETAVRFVTARRIKEVLAEIDQHTKKIAALHEELFSLHQQYLCYPHDWVADGGMQVCFDTCTKCGATHAY